MNMNISNQLLIILDEAKKIAEKNGMKRVDVQSLFVALILKGELLYNFFKDKGISEETLVQNMQKMLKSVSKEEIIVEEYTKELVKQSDKYSFLKKYSVIPIDIDYDGKKVKYTLDLNVYALIVIGLGYLEESKRPLDMLTLEAVFIYMYPYCLEDFLKALKLDLNKDLLDWLDTNHKEMMDWLDKSACKIEEADSEDEGFIPSKLSKALFDLTESQMNVEKCRVGGREKETEAVWDIFYRRKKNNPVLVGELGVGKSAIIEKVAWQIAHNKCPDDFKDYKVIELNLNSLFIETVRESEDETNFKILSKWLEKVNNVILVIDEMPTVMESSKMLTISIMLNHALNTFLSNKTCRMIVAASDLEHMLYFEMTNSMPKRFEEVEVLEPKISEVYPMIKTKIKELEDHYSIEISKKMVDFTILNSACIFFEENEPERSLKAIEKAIITAKRSGKSKVDKKMILKSFKTNFELYENLTESDKKSTAYHEAGHFLVSYYSENIVNKEVIAVSIIPADNYMGVTVYNERKRVAKGNRDYIIDEIATDLAGRVAEKIYTGEYSMGASSDLQKASFYAYYMVCAVGMGETIGKNKCVYNDFLNENMKQKVEMETQRIINQAYERAEQILRDHSEELEKTVEALLEKGIIGKKEIEEICGKIE